MSTQINIKGSTEPTGTAGGDLSGTYPNPTVDGLQGQPVSNATPVNGQVLQYDGTTWVPGSIPSGGSGGGGVVYYLNFNTAADTPLTNIPQTPNTSKELGITAETAQTSYTSAILPTANYVFLASFVTDLNTPSSNSIPAGLWDFNIYAESTTSNAANQTSFQIQVLKYDGSNAPVLLGTSNEIYIYDPTEVTQYVASVILPQTTIASSDRIVVYLSGKAHQNNKNLTFRFGGSYPSHVHSTIPSVTGTGVVKVLNGVFQSPASTIVNADVSATAAIEVSKLSMSSNRILGRTAAGSGSVEEISLGVTGNSGSATLSGNTLNIPTYTLAGLGGVPTSRTISTTAPLSGGGDLSADRTLSISDAEANGTTKGVATFTLNDFNSASGVISLDYTNGQKASGSQDGFLSASNWTDFNNKVSTGAITGSGLTMATSRLLGRSTALSGAVEEITLGTGLSFSGTTLNATGGGGSLTVGTTSIASGTAGRVLFEGTGNVLQEDANFTFNSTLKRLTLKSAGSTASDVPLLIEQSVSGNLAYINGLGDVTLGTASVNTGSGGDGNYIAIGSNSQVWNGFGRNPIAIGKGTRASGNSIAIGNGALASDTSQSTTSNISIGNGATTLAAADDCIAIGRATTTGQTTSTIAIGAGINFGGFSGRESIAVGTYFNGVSFVDRAYAFGSGVSDVSRASLGIGDSFSIYIKATERSFFVNKNTNIVMRSQAALTSGTHFDANATNTLTIHNGTAPATNIANAQQLYAELGALRCRDGNGDITNLAGTIQSVVSAATVTPVSTNKFVKITAQAVALTMAAPTGTMAEAQDLMIRIKDNGTAQTIAWNAIYRAIGVTLPTTTVAGKTTYVGLIYNSNDTTWDVIGVTTQA